jgi:hypothetical protein
MALNCWEGRTEGFLETVFDGDAEDIVTELIEQGKEPVMEIGFGNNRLLRRIREHPELKDLSYFGFDKTKTFVNRAMSVFRDNYTSFGLLNMECLGALGVILKHVDPEVLILRYVIEHLPEWRGTLEFINEKGPPVILISLFVSSEEESWSEVKEGYTVNHIIEDDLVGLLSGYKRTLFKAYDGVPHTFRVFERCTTQQSDTIKSM